jgi:hypothetical protein
LFALRVVFLVAGFFEPRAGDLGFRRFVIRRLTLDAINAS